MMHTLMQGEPLMLPDDVTSRFSSVELHIRSFSADWLYQVRALGLRREWGARQQRGRA